MLVRYRRRQLPSSAGMGRQSAVFATVSRGSKAGLLVVYRVLLRTGVSLGSAFCKKAESGACFGR